MRDQSFSAETLARLIRKSDFEAEPALANFKKLPAILDYTADLAHKCFDSANPFTRATIRGKPAYIVRSVPHRLIRRKVRENIRGVLRVRHRSRDAVVANLDHFLREGVPYRVYRLDVKNFYESFDQSLIVSKINATVGISPLSKRILRSTFEAYKSIGGIGIPRGLALSATLADFMMEEFDSHVRTQRNVYLYSRYVDDVIVLTNCREEMRSFLSSLSAALPQRLQLNPSKQCIREAAAITSKGTPLKPFDFEYLGYRFEVSSTVGPGQLKHAYRQVRIDMAEAKVRRIKTRIARSFLMFRRDWNFDLLRLRIMYLTSNICVKDHDRNTHKLSGIYHNYPRITPTGPSALAELDAFLKMAVTSKSGRLFSVTSTRLTRDHKKKLLSLSFQRGHRTRLYRHFSLAQRKQILSCWRHG